MVTALIPEQLFLAEGKRDAPVRCLAHLPQRTGVITVRILATNIGCVEGLTLVSLSANRMDEQIEHVALLPFWQSPKQGKQRGQPNRL